MAFRKDINGLRAIAVIAVVLFHFNSSWMTGGFAGVDVFFVISGFLMTRIIFRGIEKKNFSLLNFYIARANRIIPALTVLCVSLLVFGWFYLTPLDYQRLGKHVVSSVGFFSNIVFWSESGYFDASSLGKWLLHTWSLSVEWQFYILYPVVLMALGRIVSYRNLKFFVIFGFFISLIVSFIFTSKSPSAAYYLLPTRMWEMLIGGLAYLYPVTISNNRKKVFEVVGLALILLSYLTVSGNTLWPGYMAFFPVFGTFLILLSNRTDSFFTGNFLFQKIGLWSYSIYLWHWPLVVFVNYFELGHMYVYFGIILSIFLGFISYKYIESINFERHFDGPVKALKSKPLYLAAFTVLAGFVVFYEDGFYSRFDMQQQVFIKAIAEQKSRPAYDSGCFDYKPVEPCTYYDGNTLTSNEPTHILIGDSHAESIVNTLSSVLSGRESYQGLKFYGMAGCFFTDNLDSIYSDRVSCANLAKKSIDEIVEKYPGIPVIYVNRLSALILGDNNSSLKKNHSEKFDKLKNGFYSTLERLAEGRVIYFMTPTPEFSKPVPEQSAINYLFKDGESVKLTLSEYEDRNELSVDLIRNVPKQHNFFMLDVKPYFCDDVYCYGDNKSIPYYRDANHLSEYGAKQLIELFEKIE